MARTPRFVKKKPSTLELISPGSGASLPMASRK